MSKLNRYNQVLLAIIGTVTLIFLVVGGILIIVSLYQDLSWGNEYEELSLMSNEKVEELVKDSLRKELISFSRIVLIDSINEKYLLPVDQAHLIDGEFVNDDELLGLTNTFINGKETYYSRDNNYNNLLIWDRKNSEISALFEYRVSINDFQILSSNERLFVLIIVTKDDTNKDGFLDYKDLEQAFIYLSNTDNLIEIPSTNRDFLDFTKTYPDEEIILLYGIDENEDGVYQRNKEPSFFYELDLLNGKTELLVDKGMLLELQRKLDGRN